MSLRRETPCDFGPCPYDAEQYCSCEYWCGADEPEDSPYWDFDDPDLDPYDIFPDEDESWEEMNNGFSFPQDNPPAPIGTPAVWIEYEEQQGESD